MRPEMARDWVQHLIQLNRQGNSHRRELLMLTRRLRRRRATQRPVAQRPQSMTTAGNIVEKGGWFRRERLVARQFRNSIDLEQTFAPTSLTAIPKMLIHYLLNLRKEFMAVTLYIKMPSSWQHNPPQRMQQVDSRIFKFLRRLPRQRTAASQWFQLLAATCRDYGLEQNLMQPTNPEDMKTELAVRHLFKRLQTVLPFCWTFVEGEQGHQDSGGHTALDLGPPVSAPKPSSTTPERFNAPCSMDSFFVLDAGM